MDRKAAIAAKSEANCNEFRDQISFAFLAGWLIESLACQIGRENMPEQVRAVYDRFVQKANGP